MTHRPRPLDRLVAQALSESGTKDWRPPLQRARLDERTLAFLNATGTQLDPWQQEVLQRHPAFRNHRATSPQFRRLSRWSSIRSRFRLPWTR